MQKLFLIPIIFTIIFSIDISAQNIIQPIEVQSLPTPEFPFHQPDDKTAVYFLNNNDEHNVVQISFYVTMSTTDGTMPYTIDFVYRNLTRWNFAEQKVLSSETDRLFLLMGESKEDTNIEEILRVSNVEHNADSIFIDDEKILLENSYAYAQSQGGEYDEYGFYLKDTFLSPSKIILGGLIGYYDTQIDGTILGLWNPHDGKAIYREIPVEPFPFLGSSEIYNMRVCPRTIELDFSIDERFFFIREFHGWYDEIPIPSVKLLDCDTSQLWDADKDVAFSSDMRYLVTERDGLPSLVDIESNTIIHQYQVEYPMTACCFSPDESQVYITTIINELHIFDTGIESNATNWERIK